MLSRWFLTLTILLVSMTASAAESATNLAAAARPMLERYRTVDPQPAHKKLHIVCWRSRERDFPSGYRVRLQAIMECIRTFYADEMERNGFGRLTFPLDYDVAGRLVIHEAVGTGTYDDYDKQTGGTPTRRDCWRALRADGIEPDHETVVLFTDLARWDPEALTFSHHSPYMGSGDHRSGLAWQLDHAGLAVSNLTLKAPIIRDGEYGRISLGKHNSIFIGGIAHELGHALGLPHCRESREEALLRGTALMGSGNRTFGDELRGEGKGTFLTMDSAMRLASHPLFSGSAKGLNAHAEARFSGLGVSVSTGGGFVLTGAVTGTVPVYAVLAYLDPDEPPEDYDARTAVAVPDAGGRFTLACRELVPGRSAVLRLVACMANGAVSLTPYSYTVGGDGTPDVSAMELSFTLLPFLTALETDRPRATSLLQTLPAGSRARRLAGTFLAARSGTTPGLQASAIGPETHVLPLSHLAPSYARVGWGRPTYDCLPRTDALLIAGGQVFETGIYAHAPATHRYELAGGGWKRLTGTCGLPIQGPFGGGSVVFVIRADGKEVFRSPTVKAGRTRTFDLDLTGVRELELSTEEAGDGGSNDWGLWLGCELRR